MNAYIRRAQRDLEKRRRSWPETMMPAPESEWPAFRHMALQPSYVWRSRRFLAVLYKEPTTHRLSVCRCALGDDGRWIGDLTWDELQSVKAQCGFPLAWAVEVYPPDGETVNVANMRHLWLLDEAPAYGWRRAARRPAA